ncbi:MAG: fluoride efflux transporter CrcB [Bacteroidia bacterium]|nr:fluoride efflux transporter CrcB [Bacteroidia bacterium]NND25298.1 fluoride efflux transporter CrcB [Flavobacteriaceae bacterium]MBT8279598.1 fluoride efflux transporter CrcB [Bacteroidia bacterium]NNK59302.1 fluoride efflux transporter CrcB [Flavobacteriaceae bacterium]NNL34019.1 fluoride efflux transporter CrcB [Flavobacteriaceae bacterium]
MKELLLVFVGGGCGSALRYFIGKQMNPNSVSFPWGTFTVNLIGSLIIGLVFGWILHKSKVSNDTVVLVVAGFCGGFTTFSAFAHESLTFLKSGQTSLFVTYVTSSIFLGLLFVWFGYIVIKQL